MRTARFRTFAILAVGICLGAAVHALIPTVERSAAAQATQPTAESETLAAEIETIKSKLPDQAHAMQDVSYHFSNLWFAGQKENWDLADFYLLETRSHLRWAVRIIPKRKDKAGQDIDLVAILQAFENTPWKQLQEAIAAKDKPAFEAKYRFTMETCYGCHKAADKPFIRLQIPTHPETPIVNFNPSAEWPQ